MKNALSLLTAALVLLLGTALNAGQISIYKDKEGVITLTDRPVPPGIRVETVIRYRPGQADGKKQAAKGTAQKRPGREQQDTRRIQRLQEQAAEAGKKAETASIEAREKIKATEEYLEKYNSKRRSQRRRHRKTAQKAIKDARDAQAAANKAIENANQAADKARSAAEDFEKEKN